MSASNSFAVELDLAVDLLRSFSESTSTGFGIGT